MDTSALIQLNCISRFYRSGNHTVQALNALDIAIFSGDFIAITGPSGSGKSTLLHLIGCLDQPDEGEYLLSGVNVALLSPDALARVRNQRIGFVFQAYNLMSRMRALDNVALPLVYRGMNWREARQSAGHALERVDAIQLADRKPAQLSGGQQQRVSIARAIVGDPDIILADEPTGALERESGDAIMEILSALNRRGQTVLVITHDPRVADFAEKQIVMVDGKILR